MPATPRHCARVGAVVCWPGRCPTRVSSKDRPPAFDAHRVPKEEQTIMEHPDKDIREGYDDEDLDLPPEEIQEEG